MSAAADPITLAVCGSNLTGDAPFSVALRRSIGGEVHEACAPAGERGDLAVLCRDLCAAHGVTPQDVREVRVDVGPGSYTGLRVAVTFVRFLQQFGGVAVRAVDSLALLAWHGRGDGAALRPMLDARRGRYHTGLYELDGERLVEREAQQAVAVDDAIARIAADQRVIVPASFAATIGDVVRARGAQCVVAERLTAAALLADGSLPLFDANAEDLEPRYLMASYAED